MNNELKIRTATILGKNDIINFLNCATEEEENEDETFFAIRSEHTFEKFVREERHDCNRDSYRSGLGPDLFLLSSLAINRKENYELATIFSTVVSTT